MKKEFLLSLTFLSISMFLGVKAQTLTATLQQGETMTPFYGENAFIEAYEAASDGDVITLSSGNFHTVGKIEKQVKIIGNGFYRGETHIDYKNVLFYGTGGSWVTTSLLITADNVEIEGIKFRYIDLYNTNNVHISNCWIENLKQCGTHTNTIIESCVIWKDSSLGKSDNCSYRNTLVCYFDNLNSKETPAFFSNCLLLHYYDYYCVEEGNIIRNYDSPYGVFNNCLLGVRHYSYADVDLTGYVNYWQGFCRNAQTKSVAGQEYHKNAFFLYPYKFEKNSSGNWNEILCEDLLTMIIYNPPTDNYSPLLNALFKTNYVGSSESFLWQKVKTDISYKGMDGTCVGIYGGSGFSDYSSIPHIIESTIESDTDSNGKLSVKLKVSVNQ